MLKRMIKCLIILLMMMSIEDTVWATGLAGSAIVMEMTDGRSMKYSSTLWLNDSPGCLNLLKTRLREPAMKRIALNPSQYQISTPLTAKQNDSSINTPIPEYETVTTTSTRAQKVLTVDATQEEQQSSRSLKNTQVSKKQQENLTLGSSTTDLLYTLVQAEAGNQDLDGCRLVADVVLNRVADPQFPDTIEQVIYAPGQFSVVHNGSLKKAKGNVSQNVMKAVDMELTQARLNTDVLYFNNSDNGGWKYGGHWFK